MQSTLPEWAEIILKVSGLVSTILVGIFGFFISRSYKRTDDDITKLFESDEKIHNRITILSDIVSHLKGEHDAFTSIDNIHERRKNKR